MCHCNSLWDNEGKTKEKRGVDGTGSRTAFWGVVNSTCCIDSRQSVGPYPHIHHPLRLLYTHPPTLPLHLHFHVSYDFYLRGGH